MSCPHLPYGDAVCGTCISHRAQTSRDAQVEAQKKILAGAIPIGFAKLANAQTPQPRLNDQFKKTLDYAAMALDAGAVELARKLLMDALNEME